MRTKQSARKPAKTKRAKALGKVKRGVWFDAKKVRVVSTNRGPVLEIRK